MTPQISPRTVVEAFLPTCGTVPLSIIYDTANAAGLSDQPVRLMIRRLIAAGDVSQEGRGRAGALGLNLRGLTDPTAIADALWPAPPILRAYEGVTQALHADKADALAPIVVRQLRLADALERAIRDDPLIPPELREGPWEPAQIRAKWSRQWNQLTAAAEGDQIIRGW